MTLAGQITGDTTLVTVALVANLVAPAAAVAELREAQQHAAQAAAVRAAVSQLHAARIRDRSAVPRQGRAEDRHHSRAETAAQIAQVDFPVPRRRGRPAPAASGRLRPRLGRRPPRPRRLGSDGWAAATAYVAGTPSITLGIAAGAILPLLNGTLLR